MTPSPTRVLVADCTLDLRTGELLRDGAPVPLQRRSFQVLVALVSRPGQLVTRDELCRLLWPDGTVVEFDNNLNSAVNKLRRALGDSAEAPRIVETLPGRGYRLLVAVSQLPPAGAANDPGVVDAINAPSPSLAVPAARRGPRWWKYAAAAVAATAILVTALMQSNEREVVVAVLTFDKCRVTVRKTISARRFQTSCGHGSVVLPTVLVCWCPQDTRMVVSWPAPTIPGPTSF